MVYKNYRWINGKRYGPYYYESYREGDSVKKRYIKFDDDKSHFKGKIKFFFYIFFVLFLLIGFFLLQKSFIGNVSFDVQTDYLSGEFLTGAFKLRLESGELIPTDSVVRISFGELSKDYFLNELISLEKNSGNFYADNINLSGAGSGYGIQGVRTIYPTLNFQLKIFSEKDEDDISEDVEEEIKEEKKESEVDKESKKEEKVDKENENSDSSSESGITGAIISEDSFVISGSVSKEKDFEYAIDDGESVELISGSVSYSGNIIEDSNVEVERDEDKIIVSSDYLIEEKGFGEDFSGSDELNLEINLSKFSINVTQSGVLVVKLIYQDNEIVSTTKEIFLEEGELNKTILNETATVNETLINETILNETLLGFNGSVITSREKIIVGKPVKWMKNISLDNPENVLIELPGDAENISVIKIRDRIETVVLTGNIISGKISADIKLEKEELGFVKFFKKIFSTITGRVVDSPIENQTIEVALQENATEYLIEYYTDAPVAIEENIFVGKEIVVSAPDNLNYEDVVAFANIEEKYNLSEAGKIKLYWKNYDYNNFNLSEIKDVEEVEEIRIVEEVSNSKNNLINNSINETRGAEIINKTQENNSLELESKIVESSGEKYLRQEMPFNAHDLDNDNLIDYIEWVVPHLSNQTFEIILITKAEHLDGNRTFVENIYEEVKALDGNFSTVIPVGDYVRVTFEKNLTRERDITVYARATNSTGNLSIEVYEKNGTEKIAKFPTITTNSTGELYKIFLDGSSGNGLSNNYSQDVFDLLITGQSGGIEFDWIVDPQANSSSTVYQCGTLDTAAVYTMNQSISGTGTCINITANNVVLDCAGYTINFSSGGTASRRVGVSVDTPDNVTIRHCIIQTQNGSNDDNNYGIYFNGVVNGTIWNNTIRTNGTSINNGLYLISSSNNNITSNNISTGGSLGSNTGIIINDGGSNLISFNVISTNGTDSDFGIELSTSSNNNITSNNISTGGSSGANNEGFFIYALSQNNTIAFNNISTSGDTNRNDDAFRFGSGDDSRNIKNNSLIRNIFGSINGFDLTFTSYDSSANGTRLIDQPIRNYSFTGVGGTLIVENTTWGEVRFIGAVNGSGGANRNLTGVSNSVIVFGNNSVFVNGSVIGGGSFNKTANITLYGIGARFVSGWNILRDGAACSNCYNFTALTATNVIFNVSSFSNYSVGGTPSDTTSPTVTIVSPTNTTYSTRTVHFNITTNENSSAGRFTLNNGANNFSMTRFNDTYFNYTNGSVNDGQYVVRFFVNDTSNNLNSTTNITFSVAVETPASSTTTSSGGGGGGSLSTTLITNSSVEVKTAKGEIIQAKIINNASREEVENGIVESIGEAEAIEFEINLDFGKGGSSGEIFNFSVEGNKNVQKHTLSVVSIEGDFVRMVIQSNLVEVVLEKGQSLKVDMVREDFFDLFVKVEDIIEGKAKLTIRQIYEPIEDLRGDYSKIGNLKINLTSGKEIRESISVSNYLNEKIDFVALHNLGDLIRINEKEFSVPAKSEKGVFVLVDARNTEVGIYSGKIILKSEKEERIIPVIVEVHDKEDPLLDVYLNISKNEFYAEDNLTFEVELYNLKSEDGVDFSVSYFVKDLDGKIILEEEENIELEGEIKLNKGFVLSKNIKEGEYILGVVVKRGNLKNFASEFFEIKERMSIVVKIAWFTIFLIVLGALGFSAFVIYIRLRELYWKRYPIRDEIFLAGVEREFIENILSDSRKNYLIKRLEKERNNLWTCYQKGYLSGDELRKRYNVIANFERRLRVGE